MAINLAAATPFSLRKNWILVAILALLILYSAISRIGYIQIYCSPFLSLSLYIYIKISLSVYDNLFTSSKEGPNIERPQHQLPRSPTKSRNNKSGRGVTLFMGLLYGDDALRGWPNMSQSVAAISPLRAIVEGGSAISEGSRGVGYASNGLIQYRLYLINRSTASTRFFADRIKRIVVFSIRLG